MASPTCMSCLENMENCTCGTTKYTANDLARELRESIRWLENSIRTLTSVNVDSKREELLAITNEMKGPINRAIEG